MIPLDQISVVLVQELRRLGDEYGPRGVANAAAQLSGLSGPMEDDTPTMEEPCRFIVGEAVDLGTLGPEKQINIHVGDNATVTVNVVREQDDDQ